MNPDDSAIRLLYQRARRELAAEAAVTVLQLGAQQSWLASGRGALPEVVLPLALGSVLTGQLFRHQPPTAAEMEDAIMVVEDTLAPARSRLLPGAQLFSADAACRAIAGHAGVHGTGRLQLPAAQLEATFGRFAEVVQGRPASMEGLPLDAGFAATLLILRELMHHLDFATLHLLPAA